MATAEQLREMERRQPCLAIASEAEQMMQRLETQFRRLSVEAFGHLEFQQVVLNDLMTLSRMVRDLGRMTPGVNRGIIAG